MVYPIIFLFPFLMAFAACMDLLTMRIGNALTLATAVAFLPVALLVQMPVLSLELRSVTLHYACGLCLLLVGFVLFAFRKIGGGDAKLLAASAIWIGWENLPDYLLIATVLGGAFAFMILTLRSFALPLALMKHTWIARLQEANSQVPYGLALGIGAIIVYPQTPVWLSVMGG